MVCDWKRGPWCLSGRGGHGIATERCTRPFDKKKSKYTEERSICPYCLMCVCNYTHTCCSSHHMLVPVEIAPFSEDITKHTLSGVSLRTQVLTFLARVATTAVSK